MSLVSYFSQGLKIVGNISYATLFTVAEAATDAFILNETIEYFKKPTNNTADKDSVDLVTYINLAVMAAAAVPMAITVTRSLYNKIFHTHDDHHDHDHDHDHDHSHQHSWKQELGEFFIIGGPFGLLTFGGSYYFLSKLFTNKLALNLGLSGFLSMVSATGNWALHGEHFHAEEGIKKLFHQIDSKPRRLKAIAFGSSILLGHFFQGFLDGKLFFKSIGLESQHFDTLKKKQIVFGVTNSLSLLLGIVIAVIEGHTEVRSMLLNESYRSNSVLLFTLVALGVASAIHAWQPTFGVAELINFVSELKNVNNNEWTSENHAHINSLPLWSKVLILAGSAVVIGIPNAYGIFNTAKDACNKTFKGVSKTLSTYGVFKNCTKDKNYYLLDEYTLDEENIVSSSSASYGTMTVSS